jgi:hypothetical protein
MFTLYILIPTRKETARRNFSVACRGLLPICTGATAVKRCIRTAVKLLDATPILTLKSNLCDIRDLQL